MDKERVLLLAQLMTTLRDSVLKLEKFYNENDMEGLKIAKEEILMLQTKIERLL